jgi:hypothetical protein
LISKLALFLEFQHQGCSKRFGTNLVMGANNERQVKGTFICFLACHIHSYIALDCEHWCWKFIFSNHC